MSQEGTSTHWTDYFKGLAGWVHAHLPGTYLDWHFPTLEENLASSTNVPNRLKEFAAHLKLYPAEQDVPESIANALLHYSGTAHHTEVRSFSDADRFLPREQFINALNDLFDALPEETEQKNDLRQRFKVILSDLRRAFVQFKEICFRREKQQRATIRSLSLSNTYGTVLLASVIGLFYAFDLFFTNATYYSAGCLGFLMLTAEFIISYQRNEELKIPIQNINQSTQALKTLFDTDIMTSLNLSQSNIASSSPP